jgi:invasion protein IalB
MAFTRTSLAALGVALAASLAFSSAAFAQAKPAAPAKPASPAAQPATPAAPAAGAPAAANDQVDPTKPQRVELVPTADATGKSVEWTKICGEDKAAKKEICYTTRDFTQKADEPPVLALAIYDVKGEDERIVRLLMPIALMLEPGARLIVDKGQPHDARFAICFPNGCFAESKLKGAVINQLKSAQTLSVMVKNQVGAEVTFVIPMKDFGKAFDGKAMDPAELQAKQKELEDQLQKQAEEMRKKLEQQGMSGMSGGMSGMSGAAPAPAAPAPATATPAAPAATPAAPAPANGQKKN